MNALTHRYKQLSFLLAASVLLVSGLPLVHAEERQQDGHQGQAMQGGSMMMAGKRGDKCRAMRHGGSQSDTEEGHGDGHQGHCMHGGPMMIAGEHGDRCRAMRHGDGGQDHAPDHALYGEDWETGLSDEQRAQLDRLFVDMIRAKAPAEARAKAGRIELAVMSTAAEPDEAKIGVKLDELLVAKRDMLRAELDYRVAVRKVLTAEQQTSYDLSLIREAGRGEGRKGHH